jgi:hypothetical protein
MLATGCGPEADADEDADYVWGCGMAPHGWRG